MLPSAKMEGVLIFDQNNDLIYQNFNDAMRAKMCKHAIDLGLMENVKRVSKHNE